MWQEPQLSGLVAYVSTNFYKQPNVGRPHSHTGFEFVYFLEGGSNIRIAQ
jgi:hypothetical protein